MSAVNIEKLLPFVEKPSRYLGVEFNTIKKDLDRVKLRIALAFPDLYEIGTSHFGLQILYHILNSRRDIAAERVYAPGLDMERQLRAGKAPLTTLESRYPLGKFDIIGFSLLYELDYTNILTMLDLSGVPFYSSQRDLDAPLIIAGGPCTCNPEPVAELFDAMVVGDGEGVILELADHWIRWKENGGKDKSELLDAWSVIDGVYIPDHFMARFNRQGFQELLPRQSGYISVQKAVVGNLDTAPFPDRPVVPFGRPVHDRLRLEISRGCSRGCRFCQAGMICRPVRERSPARLLRLADAALRETGYEDLSLMSLSTGDYTRLDALMAHLMARCEPDRVAVSFPSLRAGKLTPELMRMVKQVRKTGFTIAPEAGSQRLRDVINKDISEEDILQTVQNAFDLGWQVIKLYFMIGLPTETREDVEAITGLIANLRRIRSPGKRRGKFNVSVTTFIPKPHTPFQWASQLPLEESRERLAWLKEHLRDQRVQLKWQDPRVSLIEGLWSRGDRRLLPVLMTAYQKGCRFDGWTDSFRFDLWEAALADNGVTPDFFTSRVRAPDEPLPWDHIDMGIDKQFLLEERTRAIRGEATPDCRWGDCQGCGVCDFIDIQPRVYDRFDQRQKYPGTAPENDFNRMRIRYSKLDDARFFGHLEMVNLFLRAFRRCGINVRYTEGFHPKPKVSFSDPLPIGMESEEEAFDIWLPVDSDAETVSEMVNSQLPEGLRVVDVRSATGRLGEHRTGAHAYVVSHPDPLFTEERLMAFHDADHAFVEKWDRKGRLQKRDLKDMVLQIDLLSPVALSIVVRQEPGKTLRPAEILTHVFNLSQQEAKRARVLKKPAHGH
ncbi:FIG092679: Fe-S oxidoreductase / FIG017108: hypothetical protein [Olavius algarvensis associated proteobacterium Delta 3]|nr:FIG092679: Fe-S oxidoreductase / FIG017108: hypothetical protein [Olavius algarvensis associated proteobacterium Delta 3]